MLHLHISYDSKTIIIKIWNDYLSRIIPNFTHSPTNLCTEMI